jgi:hypothetical protein
MSGDTHSLEMERDRVLIFAHGAPFLGVADILPKPLMPNDDGSISVSGIVKRLTIILEQLSTLMSLRYFTFNYDAFIWWLRAANESKETPVANTDAIPSSGAMERAGQALSDPLTPEQIHALSRRLQKVEDADLGKKEKAWAYEIGISRSTLSKIKNKRNSNPGRETRIKLERFFSKWYGRPVEFAELIEP